LEVALEDFGACALTEHTELYADDLKAVNEKDAERVAPVRVGLRPDGKILLKKHSWNMLRYRVNG
ncbi:MAG: alpha-N-arabinofuranosidase, partial [Clostridia bacterium]|nr:alpha-N-arabinofuranosidase [Clostridia bacterium]